MANSSETQLLIREMGVRGCVCDPSQSPAAPLSLGLGSSSRNICKTVLVGATHSQTRGPVGSIPPSPLTHSVSSNKLPLSAFPFFLQVFLIPSDSLSSCFSSDIFPTPSLKSPSVFLLLLYSSLPYKVNPEP